MIYRRNVVTSLHTVWKWTQPAHVFLRCTWHGFVHLPFPIGGRRSGVGAVGSTGLQVGPATAWGEHVIELLLHVEGRSLQGDANRFSYKEARSNRFPVDDFGARDEFFDFWSSIVYGYKVFVDSTIVSMLPKAIANCLSRQADVIRFATQTCVDCACKMVDYMTLLLNASGLLKRIIFHNKLRYLWRAAIYPHRYLLVRCKWRRTSSHNTSDCVSVFFELRVIFQFVIYDNVLFLIGFIILRSVNEYV